jgi:hypothetical protein
LGIQHTGLTLARYWDMLFYFDFQDLIKTKMNINSVMHMTNFAAQEINILYSRWSKVDYRQLEKIVKTERRAPLV